MSHSLFKHIGLSLMTTLMQRTAAAFSSSLYSEFITTVQKSMHIVVPNECLFMIKPLATQDHNLACWTNLDEPGTISCNRLLPPPLLLLLSMFKFSNNICSNTAPLGILLTMDPAACDATSMIFNVVRSPPVSLIRAIWHNCWNICCILGILFISSSILFMEHKQVESIDNIWYWYLFCSSFAVCCDIMEAITVVWLITVFTVSLTKEVFSAMGMFCTTCRMTWRISL